MLASFSAPRRRGSPASWLLQKRDSRLAHVVRVRAIRYRCGAGLPSVTGSLPGLTTTDCRIPHLAAPRLPSMALSPVGASLLAIFSPPRRCGSPASWLPQQRDPRLVHIVRVRAVRYSCGAGLPSVTRCFSGLTATYSRRRIRAAPAVPLPPHDVYAAIPRALPALRAICVVAGEGTAIPYIFFVTLHCAVLARCGCRVNSSFQTSPT